MRCITIWTCAFLLLLVASLSSPHSAMGATAEWDGGDTTGGNWSAATNWVGEAAPVNDDTLIFPQAASRKANTNDGVLSSVHALSLGGGYTIDGDALVLGNAVTNTGDNTLAVGLSLTATKRFDVASGALTLSGAVSGGGGLQKEGAGTLTYGAVNTYSGDTTVNGGTLIFTQQDGMNVNSAFFVSSGGVMRAQANRVLAAPHAGTATITHGGIMEVAGGSGAAYRFMFNTLDMTGGTVRGNANGGNSYWGLSATTINVHANPTPSTLSVDYLTRGNGAAGTQTYNVDAGAQVNVSGRIRNGYTGGVVGLAKSGPGTLVLGGANTYTGGTTLGAGTLRGNNRLSFGPAGADITLDGGTLALGSGVNSDDYVVALSVDGSANLQAIGPTHDLVGSLSGTGTLAFVGSASIRYEGDMSGFTGTFVQDSSATYQLMIDNGAYGVTATNSGNPNAFFVVNSGGIYLLNNSQSGTAYMGALSGSGGTIYSKWNRSGDVTLEVGALGTNTTYGGRIANGDTGPTRTALTKVGPGELTLSGVGHTYTGNTTVNGGTLNISGYECLNPGTALIVNSGGVLKSLSNRPFVGSAAGVATINAGGTIAVGNAEAPNRWEFSALDMTGGTVSGTFSGSSAYWGLFATEINIHSNATPSTISVDRLSRPASAGTMTVAVDKGARCDVSGVIRDTYTGGYVGLTKAGAGSLALTGYNVYKGRTTVDEGLLDLSNGSIYYLDAAASQAGLVNVSTGGTLRVGNWAWSNTQPTSLGDLARAAANVVVDGGTVQFAVTLADARAITVGAGGATLEVLSGVDMTQSYFAGLTNAYTADSTLTLAGAGTGTARKVISGNGVAVVKDGSGTWSLAAAHTYTGDTTVLDGTLVLAPGASLNTSTTVRIASGAVMNLGSGINQTVRALWLNGVQMWPGTWGSPASAAENRNAYFGGTGILTVTEGGTYPGTLLIVR